MEVKHADGFDDLGGRVTYISSEQTELTDKDFAKFREAFKLFDKDDSGKITSSDLNAVMRRMGLTPTEEEIQTFIDENGKGGMIDFKDFVTMMMTTQQTNEEDEDQNENEELLAAFKAFDQDGNGTIEEDELRIALKNIGENFTDNEITLMMQAADKNGDGKIDFSEFVRMVHML